MDELRKMRGDIEKGGKGQIRDAGVITQNDLARMRAEARIISEKDAADAKKISDEQRQVQ